VGAGPLSTAARSAGIRAGRAGNRPPVASTPKRHHAHHHANARGSRGDTQVGPGRRSAGEPTTRPRVPPYRERDPAARRLGRPPLGPQPPPSRGASRCRRSAVPERDRLDLERDRPILERIGISPQDVLGGLSDTYGVRSGPGGGDFQVAPPNRGSLRTPRDPRSQDRAHSPCPLRGTGTARGWSPPIRPRRGWRPRPPSNTGNLAAAL
jgi:hypothetical protein